MQELVLQQHLISKQVTNKQKTRIIAIISVKTFEMLNYQSFLKKCTIMCKNECNSYCTVRTEAIKKEDYKINTY